LITLETALVRKTGGGQSAVAGKVVRSTVTNAYNFLDIQLGRVMAQDLFIGAFNIGVNIDTLKTL